jgi:hypothetical protein
LYLRRILTTAEKGISISWKEIDAARIEAHHARTRLVIFPEAWVDVKEHLGSIQ